MQGLICHVGFAVDGQQYVIPTCYGRVGETLYIHGSAVSRTLKTLAVCSSCACILAGATPACKTACLFVRLSYLRRDANVQQ